MTATLTAEMLRRNPFLRVLPCSDGTWDLADWARVVDGRVEYAPAAVGLHYDPEPGEDWDDGEEIVVPVPVEIGGEGGAE